MIYSKLHNQLLIPYYRELGLFPYLKPDKLELKDLLAFEAHRTKIGNEDVIFHQPQAEVFYKLTQVATNKLK